MNNNSYRADVDGLRAIAVLSVMLYHLNAYWLPGGFVGVDVFFVISGFVVTGSLIASQAKSVPAFIGEFYARRLARIMPALVLMLCVSALLATFFIPHAWLSEFSERTALFAFAGLGNWVMQQNDDAYFAPRAEFNPYTHTWSLGVEEQFYLVAPLMIYLWLLARRATHASRLHEWFLALFFLLCAASFVGCLYATDKHPTAAFYFFGFRFWELGLGALLHLATVGRTPFASPVIRVLRRVSPSLGALLIGLACVLATAKHFPWPWVLSAVLGSLLLIGGARADIDVPVRRLLATRPFLWVGKRSYSLYLWHWPVYVLLRWTVGLHTLPLQIAAFAASFMLAALSYRYVETSLRHHARIEYWHPRYRIVFFIGLTALGWWSTQHLFTHYDQYSLSIVSRNKIDWYVDARMPNVNSIERPCEVDLQFYDIGGGHELRYVPRNCHDRSPFGVMHVLGDSHATAYLPMFDQLSAETGRTISVYSFPGCPYIDFYRPMHQNRSSGCDEFTRAIMQRVLDKASEGDLVFLPSLRIYRYGDQWANSGHDVFQKMYNPDALKLREAAIDEAKQWLQSFVDKKLYIIFEAPKPIFKAPPFRCSDWFNRHNPICVGDNQQPRAEMQRLREPIVTSMYGLTHVFPSVSVWDPFPILCPGDTCFTEKDGRPLFFDGDHLSAYGNMVLYPHFKTYIDALLAESCKKNKAAQRPPCDIAANRDEF